MIPLQAMLDSFATAKGTGRKSTSFTARLAAALEAGEEDVGAKVLQVVHSGLSRVRGCERWNNSQSTPVR